MKTTKEKISVSISPRIFKLLTQQANTMNTSKSHLVEEALEHFFLQKLENDAKKIANATFPDLPTEEEWLHIQSPLS